MRKQTSCVFYLVLQSVASITAFIPSFTPLPPPPCIMTPTAASSVLLASTVSRGQVNLVNALKREGVIRQKQVIDVMLQVDRKNYIEYEPYWDSPQGIECGQTISAPHMHGFALEEMLPALLASPRPSLKLLDVGCGSGYLTAALGRWVQPKLTSQRILPKPGTVYGMDIYPRLVDLTRSNIMKQDQDLLDRGTVQLQAGDGWKGWPDAGPFDAIHVGAAADAFPTTLANQLAVGGVMVIPIGPQGGIQYFYRVERVAQTGKLEQDFQTHRLMGVRYVPLIRYDSF